MAEYRVLRSFGENKRGKKVELTQKDAAALLAGDRPYVAEIQTAEKKTDSKKS